MNNQLTNMTYKQNMTPSSCPEILRATVRKVTSQSSDYVPATDTISITLFMGNEVDIVTDDIKAICYTETLRKMGEGLAWYKKGQTKNSILQICIHSDNIWLDGDYYAILLHNSEPFVKLIFTLEGNKKGQCVFQKIHKDSIFHALPLEMEKNEGWTIGLHELSGVTKAKFELLRQKKNDRLGTIYEKLNYRLLAPNRHYVITGPKAAAMELADCISPLFGLRLDCLYDCTLAQLIEATASDEDYAGYTDIKLTVLRRRSKLAICLTELHTLQQTSARLLVEEVEKAMKDKSIKWSLILIGSEAEINHFFRLTPELSEYFPACNYLCIEPFTVQETVPLILDELKKNSFVLSQPALPVLVNGIKNVCDNRLVANWSKKFVHEFVWEGIIHTKHKRIMEMSPTEEDIALDSLLVINPEDIDFSFFRKVKKESVNQPTDQTSLQALFDSSMSALQAMIGLESIKKNLTTTLNLVRFNENRKVLGLKIDQTNVHHMIFTGNPGTGKTTVAKLIGKIYHSLGMLSKGDVIVTERSKIVGKYIGTTEENMTKLLAEAKGNVLFIDEAYTLFTGEQEDNRDFGLRVIESLLAVLAEDNLDMIVILAGYEKEMDKMLQFNQGLKGRFPHHFHFEDYTVGELSQIGDDYLGQYDYVLTDKAREMLLQHITDTVARKDPAFSNARWMRRLITHGIIPEMARRIMTNNLSLDKNCYQTIEADDVVSAISLINENTRQAQPIRKKLGFIA